MPADRPLPPPTGRPADLPPPATGPAPSLGHVPALDGLRGVAVAVVVAFHANWLKGGYLGVDVFFVLSGFLITRLLLDEHQRRGRIDLKRFWKRRARRLLPALLVVIAVAAVAERARGRIDGPAGGRIDVLGALTYTTNWLRLRSGAGYWANFGGPSLLDHTWSLAIEEQFYVIWPLVVIVLLRAVKRRGARVLTLATLTAVAAAWSIIAFNRSLDASRVYMGTDTRAVALLAGATVAALYAWRTVRSTLLNQALAVAATGFLVSSFVTLSGTALRTYHGGLLACSIAAALVIGAAAMARPPLLARPLTWAPLRYLGERSYGIYLWHWPIMVGFGVAKAPLSPTWRRLVAIALSLAAAELSYRVVEQPIRVRGLLAFGPRWRPLLGATAVTALAIGAVALPETVGASSVSITLPTVATTTAATAATTATVTVTKAVPSTPPEPAAAAGATTTSAAATPTTTEAATTTTTTTTVDLAVLPPVEPPPGRPPRVLYVGDSVAWFLAIEAGQDAGRLGIQVTNGAEPACPMAHAPMKRRLNEGAVPLVFEKRCADAVNGYRALVARTKPDTVIIGFGASLFDENEIAPDVWAAPCSAEFDRWFQDEIRRITDDLGSTGARVYWTTQAYYRAENNEHTAALDTQTDCENTRAADVAGSSGGALGLVRLGEWTCPTRACLEQRDGVELRKDGTHFKADAALLANIFVLTQVFSPPPWQQ